MPGPPKGAPVGGLIGGPADIGLNCDHSGEMSPFTPVHSGNSIRKTLPKGKLWEAISLSARDVTCRQAPKMMGFLEGWRKITEFWLVGHRRKWPWSAYDLWEDIQGSCWMREKYWDLEIDQSSRRCVVVLVIVEREENGGLRYGATPVQR